MAIPRIPERFLRYVWQNQIFSSFPLLTSGGARVAVRFPGSMNPDGGPDFTGASIRIGHVLYRGDVELHVRACSWRSHGHSTDPHFNKVILHVVLFPGRTSPPVRTSSGRIVPLLVLFPFVDPLLYGRWRNGFGSESAPSLQCRRRHSVLPPEVLGRKIRSLGCRRIESRVCALGKRLRWLIRDSGTGSGEEFKLEECLHAAQWEQLLYECLLEGMGYAGNSSSFLALARSVPLSLLKTYGLAEARTMQALLFGAAGLLPPMRTLRENESRERVRTLRRKWRILRPGLRIPLLHEGDWVFFRLRPANFPTARLAALCFLLPSLFAGHGLDRVLGIVRQSCESPREKHSSLVSMFSVSSDMFWSRHIHFRGTRGGIGIALGRARVDELIVNGIVPLLLLRARVCADTGLRRKTLAVLRALPSAGENKVTRLVKAAFPGMKGGMTALRSPLEHQGILHLFGAWCSRTRCIRCPLVAEADRGKPPVPAGSAHGLRMSRRRSPVRRSSCSRR